MATGGEIDKKGQDEGLKLDEQERKFKKFLEYLKSTKRDLSDDGVSRKTPSQDWGVIKAVDFRTNRSARIDVVKSSFRKPDDPAVGNMSNTHSSNGKDKSTSAIEGTKLHSKLNKYIKKRLGKSADLDLEPSEEELEEFINNLENSFKFRIIASELEISGYASHKQLDVIHHWNGIIDAIGVGEDGRLIVVDWIRCNDLCNFWKSATEFSKKLHQTMIYQAKLTAHLEYFFEGSKFPEVGIIIVPISSKGIEERDPRLCRDFAKLRNAGFFFELNKYVWTAQKPSAKGNSRSRQTTNKVCSQSFCDEDKQNPSEVLEESTPGIKSASLVKNHLPQLRSVPDTLPIIKGEPTVKTEKLGCPCGPRKKCAHATGEGKCECKAVGKKCGELCHCNEEICKNRASLGEIKVMRDSTSYERKEPIRQMPDLRLCIGRTYHALEEYGVKNWYQAPVEYGGRNWYQTPEKYMGRNPGEEFKEKAGCPCGPRKKCAHAKGTGKCECKAVGKKCGQYCNCDEEICKNRP